MKKFCLLLLLIGLCHVTNAQDGYDVVADRDFIKEMTRIVSILLSFVLLAIFIVTMTRMFLDYRIKHAMIQKGVPETAVMQFLSVPKLSRRHQAMKWFALLTGLAFGLLLMRIFRPYGVHSLAIISFCIAAAFLGYFLYLRRSERETND